MDRNRASISAHASQIISIKLGCLLFFVSVFCTFVFTILVYLDREGKILIWLQQ